MELSRLTTLQLRSLDELWLKWRLRGKKKEKKNLKQSCKPEPLRSIYRSRKLVRDLTYTLIAASFPMLNQKSLRSTESQFSYSTGRLWQFSFYTSPSAILILKYTWRIQRFYDQSSLIECLQLRDSKTSSQSIVEATNVKDWNNLHKWVFIFQISTKISKVMPPFLH